MWDLCHLSLKIKDRARYKVWVPYKLYTWCIYVHFGMKLGQSPILLDFAYAPTGPSRNMGPKDPKNGPSPFITEL